MIKVFTASRAKRYLVSVVLLYVTVFLCPAQASHPNTIDDFEFTQNASGTITITGYKTGAPRDVVIPDNIEGIAVTEIAEAAFSGIIRDPLTSVIIPDSVITIGAWAFYPIVAISSLVIPDSVTSIGPLAFAGADSTLGSLTIGRGIKIIPYMAFSDNKLTSVVIPNSVTTIESEAFGNNKLTEVTFGSSVRTIGEGAFAGNQISSLVIPASVREFEAGVFRNNALTSIVIPAGVTYIGPNTFADNRITSVTITSNTTTFGGDGDYNDFARARGPFVNNPITSITLPANADFRVVSSGGRQSNTIIEVFPNNFNAYYQSQGRRAGTYTWSGRLWSVR